MKAAALKALAACVLLAAASAAHACPKGDCWGEEHVSLHLGGEFVLGAAAGLATDNKPAAFAAAFAVGLAREQWKREHGFANYQPSRLVADAAGAALGVYVGRCVLMQRSITCAVEF